MAKGRGITDRWSDAEIEEIDELQPTPRAAQELNAQLEQALDPRGS